MPKLLERAVSRLNTGIVAKAGVKVTVLDNHGKSLTDVDAVPGRQDFSQYLLEESQGTAKEFDWIVAANDLVFVDNGKQEPAKGWQILYVLDDERTAVYEVNPTTGTRAFDVVDAYGILYRVHTKLKEIRPAI